MKRLFNLSTIAFLLGTATAAGAQIVNPYPPLVKQIAAPLPKLALKGAVPTLKGRIQYHEIILTVTNRSSIPADIFMPGSAIKLPPNPCGPAKTRSMLAIFDDRGISIAKCMPLPGSDSLGEFSFLIEKGKKVPPFVYVTINDLYTGAVYRSNLVSPFGGATK